VATAKVTKIVGRQESPDGDGHRRNRNLNGTETWQVHGIGGELMAEYATNASPSRPQKEYGLSQRPIADDGRTISTDSLAGSKLGSGLIL
jgi:hypothetical protein